MLARVVRPIAPDDTSDVVERDLAAMGADLLVSVVDDLAAGPRAEVPQNEAEATYAPRLTKDEGKLDFQGPAIAIHNAIRGLRPWPMAFTFLNGARARAASGEVVGSRSQEMLKRACVSGLTRWRSPSRRRSARGRSALPAARRTTGHVSARFSRRARPADRQAVRVIARPARAAAFRALRRALA